MSGYEIQDIPKWKHPRDYFGFSPDGDYLIYTRHMDSCILENSIYECIFNALQEKDPDNFVYDFRASHFAYGWVEYILITQDAPIELLNYACDILSALSDYPVFDESDYSEHEWNYAHKYWDSMDLREKIELCKKYGYSIFAARHESIPDMIYDWIISGA